MKKKVLSFVMILTLILGIVTGCSSTKTSKESGDTTTPAPAKEKVLIVRSIGDPMSFNPDTLADDNAYAIVQNIYNRLVKMDASKNVIPDLAQKWDVKDEGKTITFYLRKDAKWHDGKPVTSKDVKYTFDTIKANSTYYFSARLAIVNTIETPDDYTVVFKINASDVSFIADLGWYGTFILPEHVYNTSQKWEDNPASMKPIGSGPFKFSEYKQGEGTTLVKNEDYHEGSPKLDKLIFSIIPDEATAVQALANGEIDFFEGVPAANVDELKANPKVRLALNEYPSPMRIIFNLQNKAVKDIALRRAIAAAVNKEEISQKIYNGVQAPEYTMYPALIKWVANTEDTTPKFSIESAVKILEDAGYKKDANGFYVTGLSLDVFEGGGYPEAAKLMEATLAQAGIDIEVAVHEFNAWNEKVYVNKDYMMELQGGFMGPDPASLATRYGSAAGIYANPEFDKLMAEAAATGDQAKRAELYKKGQALLARDLPFIPIVAYAAYDANNSSFVNLPIDGAGKWGWAEFTFTDLK